MINKTLLIRCCLIIGRHSRFIISTLSIPSTTFVVAAASMTDCE